MARGGCRVTTDNASIDARFEASVAAAMRGLLGDDRAERSNHAGGRLPRKTGMSGVNANSAPNARAAGASASTRRWRAPRNLPSPPVEGSLTRMVGLALEASGCQAAVGDVCDLLSGDGSRSKPKWSASPATNCFSCPRAKCTASRPSARVIPRQRAGSVRVGPGLLGRIIDGTGTPLDGLGPTAMAMNASSCWARPSIRWQRHPIDTPLDVGVRSINSLLTVGRGQRIGLFAGSGVGKSRAARHDGALHQRRRHRRRADR